MAGIKSGISGGISMAWRQNQRIMAAASQLSIIMAAAAWQASAGGCNLQLSWRNGIISNGESGIHQ